MYVCLCVCVLADSIYYKIYCSKNILYYTRYNTFDTSRICNNFIHKKILGCMLMKQPGKHVRGLIIQLFTNTQMR